jgi:DNA polymerase-3 subunit gamma/tau
MDDPMSNYQVLARKWRPQTFTDLVGQDHIAGTLVNAIRSGRVGHAYLFVGTRGIGKTTSARIFAKALNCEAMTAEGNPCLACQNCQEIGSGASMDVIEIDGASNNSVDDIRRIRDNVVYAPTRCRFKIYIIDEVHMLSTQAWNALLKTLEEPPAHVKFLFATTEAHKVLPTIISRCQRFDLKRISQKAIAERLGAICQAEKVVVEPAALNAVSRAANGGMRDALSILDQLIAFRSGSTSIGEADVLEVFGLTSQAELLQVLAAMLNNDAQELLFRLDRLSREAKNLDQLYSDLVGLARSLLVAACSPRNAAAILEVDGAEFELIARLAGQADAGVVQRLADGLLNHESKLKSALNKRATLELTLLRVMRDAQAVQLDEVLRRLARLRQSGGEPLLEAEIGSPARPRIALDLPEAPASPAAEQKKKT